ncbi:MAG: DNA-binding response OmpR family regulator [Pseudohongiellaceae bacterium]|jgi:DNA-binding response OmpR family regulator
MDTRSNIMVIDNNSEELMQLITCLEGKYILTELPEGGDFTGVATAGCVDLILLDDMLAEPNCYDICQDLKSDDQTKNVPIIIMSDLDASELEREINFLGSDDYICKPIKQEELLEKIETLLSFNRVN